MILHYPCSCRDEGTRYEYICISLCCWRIAAPTSYIPSKIAQIRQTYPEQSPSWTPNSPTYSQKSRTKKLLEEHCIPSSIPSKRALYSRRRILCTLKRALHLLKGALHIFKTALHTFRRALLAHKRDPYTLKRAAHALTAWLGECAEVGVRFPDPASFFCWGWISPHIVCGSVLQCVTACSFPNIFFSSCWGLTDPQFHEHVACCSVTHSVLQCFAVCTVAECCSVLT